MCGFIGSISVTSGAKWPAVLFPKGFVSLAAQLAPALVALKTLHMISPSQRLIAKKKQKAKSKKQKAKQKLKRVHIQSAHLHCSLFGTT
jgi:hypothetical protein